MGETVHILAIDDNQDRVKRLIQLISDYDPDIKIDHPMGIQSLLQFIEANTYDCIITPDEISLLNNFELKHKISEIVSTPFIRYLGESRPPTSTELYEPCKDMHHEDALSSILLANRIRKTLNSVIKNGRVTVIDLPETPRVKVSGNKIFIVNENGSEEFWGNESDEVIEEVADIMELELKTIQWVRLELERFIGELTETIKGSDIPSCDISDLVYEGYRSLLLQFQRIDKSHNQR